MPPKSQVSPPRCADLVELCSSTPLGCFVEVGVYQGGSAYHLYGVARQQLRNLHLFDTFSGMPYQDDGDTFKQGSFHDTTPEAVQSWMPEAKLYVGEFPATLPHDLRDVAFAHFDCDQHRATLDCIKWFLPRMVRDGIMAFDDYPGIDGVVRAVQQYFTPQKVHFTRHRFAYVICPGPQGRVFDYPTLGAPA